MSRHLLDWWCVRYKMIVDHLIVSPMEPVLVGQISEYPLWVNFFVEWYWCRKGIVSSGCKIAVGNINAGITNKWVRRQGFHGAFRKGAGKNAVYLQKAFYTDIECRNIQSCQADILTQMPPLICVFATALRLAPVFLIAIRMCTYNFVTTGGSSFKHNTPWTRNTTSSSCPSSDAGTVMRHMRGLSDAVMAAMLASFCIFWLIKIMYALCVHTFTKLASWWSSSLSRWFIIASSAWAENLYVSGRYVLILFILPAHLKSYASSMLVQMREIVTLCFEFRFRLDVIWISLG